ncbi:MAG: biotin/lipoyl-binding protein, partial [Mesorhizobium sp.]
MVSIANRSSAHLRFGRRTLLRYSFVAGLLAAGLTRAPGLAVAQQPEPPLVTVAKPVVRDIVEDDEFVGRFEAVDDVSVRSRVAGYLDEVHFRDGAMVNKGDLLFTIDRRPYQAAYD